MPVATEREEHARLLLPEDSRIAELKQALEIQREATKSATDFANRLQESLTDSEKRNRQIQHKSLDWGGEWKLAEDGFRLHYQANVSAQRQYETPGKSVTWSLQGGDSYIRTDIEATCSRAGALLLSCPGFDTVAGDSLRDIQSDWQRWLQYMSERYHLSDVMTGSSYDENGKKVGLVQVGDIRNIAALSASECVKCAALALRFKQLW